MTLPWVSILTPLCNGEQFLEECAMSVFLQTTSTGDEAPPFTWEWIIGVNGHGHSGGSPFQLAKLIEEKAKKHIGECRMRVVNLPHARGKVEALNALAREAKGDWIALLDCDDTWERDKLAHQKLVADAFGNTVDIIGTACRYIGDVQSDGPTLPSGWLTPEMVARSNPIINSSVILRNELAFWVDRFGLEDYDMWLRYSKRGKRLFNVPERLVNHRLHAGSAFNGKGKQDLAGLRAFHRV